MNSGLWKRDQEDLFYRDYDNNYMSTDVTGANKNFSLFGGYITPNSWETGNLKFNLHYAGTTTITNSRIVQLNFDTGSTRASAAGDAKFAIIKVIGYK